MKVATQKFLLGIAIIFSAVFLYWAFNPKYEGFFTPGGAQEQLASSKTQVGPVNPITDEQKKALFNTSNLPSLVLDTGNVERPYLTNPINSLDDYEYNLVFQNEGSREMTQSMKNALTSQYPFDWSKLPPSAAEFQAGQSALYQAKPTGTIPTDTYKAIEDASLQPPDMDAIEDEERKILATYIPKHASDLTTYDVEDARELIEKIYNGRDQIPEVVEKGNNVFEIVGVQSKNPKIVYEDEPGPSVGGQMYSDPKAFDVISVPQAATDTSAALDPFYEPRNSIRTTRTDYTRWTPGLERMFAPTYEDKNWY
jgi:hypothetical protein